MQSIAVDYQALVLFEKNILIATAKCCRAVKYKMNLQMLVPMRVRPTLLTAVFNEADRECSYRMIFI